ncbi:uncharacterized protein MONBRDRAFT_27751 [Monosiga brevicollis MX1]|uniref:Hexosyltransferase n=1 Tax=Monosiga brevicollis TaxID=81824 RepID=A9V675_MONBE|nr:uncharacterized protein MONBRDRAFT_27751 [Monosiga brevicollis MX1]EDQ87023.1 predicted protein [Monosiga brevicollis MX1]|eukprot:XP_001748262.1 hypothetical protein [Monosiga brevicollis MX1]
MYLHGTDQGQSTWLVTTVTRPLAIASTPVAPSPMHLSTTRIDPHRTLYVVTSFTAERWSQLPGPYQRAAVLDHGVGLIPAHERGSAIVFLTDVEVIFTEATLARCRHLADLNLTYFPITFSAYRHAQGLRLNDASGKFRHSGYGLVCTRVTAYETVGGLDTSITGWGDEDKALVNAFLKHPEQNVWRAPDRILHRWHTKTCDPALPKERLLSCHKSLMDYEGSKEQLAEELRLARLQLAAES